MGLKLFISILTLLTVGAFAQNSIWNQPISSTKHPAETPIEQPTENGSCSADTAEAEPEETFIIFTKNKRVEKMSVAEYFAVDSVEIYDKRITRTERTQDRLSTMGTVFISIGVVAIGSSIYFFSSDEDERGAIALLVAGYSITPGIILACISRSKGTRLDQLRQSRDAYIRKKEAYQISIAPTFQLQNQSAGARLSLNF